jgi:hypothetical protein
MFRLQDIGLLCDGDNDFVVADLKIVPKDGSAYRRDDTPVQAGLCLFRSWSGKADSWESTVPRIRHRKDQGKDLTSWRTDVVIPFGDRLCYVDYFRGIFFVDVLSSRPELRFVKLPVKTPVDDPVGFRGCPAVSRSVCVTRGGGAMKFVEVVTTATLVLGCSSSSYDSSSFTINLWILKEDGMTWERQVAMQDTELWSLPGFRDSPRLTPSFPLVSMEDPGVIYFVLNSRSWDVDNETWVIVVDMSKKILVSLVPYTEVFENCLESDGDMACRNIATNRAFIPCEIPKYLYVPKTR